jgi:hypothetical protein
MTRELAPKMECNFCNENVSKDLWIRFFEGNWQREFGVAKR